MKIVLEDLKLTESVEVEQTFIKKSLIKQTTLVDSDVEEVKISKSCEFFRIYVFWLFADASIVAIYFSMKYISKNIS